MTLHSCQEDSIQRLDARCGNRVRANLPVVLGLGLVLSRRGRSRASWARARAVAPSNLHGAWWLQGGDVLGVGEFDAEGRSLGFQMHASSGQKAQSHCSMPRDSVDVFQFHWAPPQAPHSGSLRGRLCALGGGAAQSLRRRRRLRCRRRRPLTWWMARGECRGRVCKGSRPATKLTLQVGMSLHRAGSIS